MLADGIWFLGHKKRKDRLKNKLAEWKASQILCQMGQLFLAWGIRWAWVSWQLHVRFTLHSTLCTSLLSTGVYVIGFSYPVVPKGKARIRVQISAAHTDEDIDHCVDAFIQTGRKHGVISWAGQRSRNRKDSAIGVNHWTTFNRLLLRIVQPDT